MALRPLWCLLAGESPPSRNLTFLRSLRGSDSTTEIIKGVSGAGRTPQNPLRASLVLPLVETEVRPEDG